LDNTAAIFKSSPRTKMYRGKEMALLKQRDLEMLVKTKASIKTIVLKPVKTIDEKIKYEIRIDIENDQGIEECLLITAKNEPQRWSSLNKAVEMLEDLTEANLFHVERYKP